MVYTSYAVGLAEKFMGLRKNIELIIILLICISTPVFAYAVEHQVVEKTRVMPTVFNPRENRQLIYIKALKSSTVSIDLMNADGNLLGAIKNDIPVIQGSNTITWTGRLNGSILTEGAYRLKISSAEEVIEIPFKILLKRKPAIQYSSVWPEYFTPNGAGPRRLQGIYYSLHDDGLASIQVLRDKKVVRTIISGRISKGSIHEEWWDGKDDQGQVLPAGPYTIRIITSNIKGRSVRKMPFRIHNKDHWQTDADQIMGQLEEVHSGHKITTEQYNSYRTLVRSTKKLLENFKEKQEIQEWIDLSYVLHKIKQRKSKIVSQHYFLFDVFLRTNFQYYSKSGSPEAWTEFHDINDTFVFVYYRNRGLQPHPVSTMIKINKIRDDVAFLASLDKIINCLDRRYSLDKLPFEQLLYHMEFQGGSAFWPSAMSQAKLLAALGRASTISPDTRYTQKARLVMNSFYVPHTQGGILDSPRSGNWYLLYPYTNKYVVMNGHVVTLQDLKTYASLTGAVEAEQLFDLGLAELAKTVYKYDIRLRNVGWWSKYSLVSYPASQRYHQFNFMLLQWLIDNTQNDEYRAILGFYKTSWEQSHIKTLASKSIDLMETSPKANNFPELDDGLWGLADFDYKL